MEKKHNSHECRSYIPRSIAYLGSEFEADAAMFSWKKWGNKNAQTYPSILQWYARKMQHPPGGHEVEPERWPQFDGPGCCNDSGLPRGRFDLHGPHYLGVDDPTFTACTGVVRKKQQQETAHLPPFRSQIAEVARRLATPKWRLCQQAGNATEAAMDGTF